MMVMMMMMMMVMIIIPVIIMIMIKITIAIMITITIMNSQDSERCWRVSPSDPWSFVMTCSLGIYVGMQTARVQSNNNDIEY